MTDLVKMINKTDQQDCSSNNQSSKNNTDDLQRFAWNDNEPIDEDTDVNHGGWSVEAMFKTNKRMGVQSTFKDDLTQYTTCMPEGTKEDRAKAAKIAREIEKSEKSKRMAYLENDDEERDLDKETAVPEEKVEEEAAAAADVPDEKEFVVVPAEEKEPDVVPDETASSSVKFQFNPEAPSFVPRIHSPAVAQPVIAQPHYYIPQSIHQGYGGIVQPITSTIPPGYVLATQGIGMQHNPNIMPPTFLPQSIPYVRAPLSMYNPQIVTSSHAGGYPTFVHAPPQTFVVQSNYDISNGYIPQTHQPQIHYAVQYQGQPLQQLPPQQQQQQYQTQLPYSQPNNGIRRYGPS